jgi:hypothetical protein
MTPEDIKNRIEGISIQNKHLTNQILAMTNDIKIAENHIQRNFGMLEMLNHIKKEENPNDN